MKLEWLIIGVPLLILGWLGLGIYQEIIKAIVVINSLF